MGRRTKKFEKAWTRILTPIMLALPNLTALDD